MNPLIPTELLRLVAILPSGLLVLLVLTVGVLCLRECAVRRS